MQATLVQQQILQFQNGSWTLWSKAHVAILTGFQPLWSSGGIGLWK